MARDELNVEPANLSNWASRLANATDTAHGGLTAFSSLAAAAHKGFPGPSSAKFNQAQEHWESEKELVAGIVTDLSVHTEKAGKGYLSTDNTNADALDIRPESNDLNL